MISVRNANSASVIEGDETKGECQLGGGPEVWIKETKMATFNRAKKKGCTAPENKAILLQERAKVEDHR